MTPRVVLRAVAGPLGGKSFEFTETDTFVFGRGLDCHGKIPESDGFASRYHFLLEVSPPQARIRDLGSLNGTIVNGRKCGGREAHETPDQAAQRASKIELKHGDHIEVGDTRFVVEIDAPAPAATAQRMPAPAAPPPRAPIDDRQAREQIQHMLTEQGALSIPGYTLEKQLGEGGMGVVYRARRERDGRRFAVKLMLPRVAADGSAIRTFIREATVATQLKHPHIVETYELGQAGGALYMIMEYCELGDIAGLMERAGGTLPVAVAGPLMLQALDGLEHAHNAPIATRLADGSERRERGIVHRDLKPQNILLGGTVDRPVAKLSDYGLAKCFNAAGLSGHTATGMVGGTPCFMPREQLLNFRHARPVSDVWAMGATLYNMLTGYVPFDFPPDKQPIAVVLQGEVVPVRRRDPRIDGRVADVVERALLADVTRRFQSAAEFRNALAAALR